MFEFMGRKVFDLSAPFSYFEVFSSAFVICGISLLIYLYLANKAKKLQQDK